jgi:hypothetical protein
MKMMLKRLALPALPTLLLLQPLAAHAWTTDINCEGGSLGSQLAQSTSLNTFTTSFTLTQYSNAQAATGSQSCKMGITAGQTGWGQFGGIVMFPSHLGPGSQVWVRVSLFVPAGFNVTTDDGMLKFIRVHTASPTVSNQGYHDLLFANPGFQMYSGGKNYSPSYVYGYEGSGTQDYPVGTSPTNNFVTGKWETYEIYLSLDSAGKAAGGQGEVRVWKNNQLMLDLTSDRTLVDKTTYAESLFLFTWWNGNAPVSQSLYVDDIIMTSDTPANKDAAGNPFIGGPTPGGAVSSGGAGGGGTTTTATTPLPPANVTVQ